MVKGPLSSESHNNQQLQNADGNGAGSVTSASSQKNVTVQLSRADLVNISTSGHQHNCLFHSILPWLDLNRLNNPTIREEFNHYFGLNYNEKQFKELLNRYSHPVDLGILLAPLLRQIAATNLWQYREELFQPPGDSYNEIIAEDNSSSQAEGFYVCNGTSINGNGTFMDFVRLLYKRDDSNPRLQRFKHIFGNDVVNDIETQLQHDKSREQILEDYKAAKEQINKIERTIKQQRGELPPEAQDGAQQRSVRQERKHQQDKIAYIENQISGRLDQQRNQLKQKWENQAFRAYKKYLQGPVSLDITEIRPLLDIFNISVKCFRYDPDAGNYLVQPHSPNQRTLVIPVYDTGYDHFELMLPKSSTQAELAKNDSKALLAGCDFDDPQNIIQTIENNQKRVTKHQRQSSKSQRRQDQQTEKTKTKDQDRSKVKKDQIGKAYNSEDNLNHQSFSGDSNSWYDNVKSGLLNLNQRSKQMSYKAENYKSKHQHEKYFITEAHSVLEQKWEEKFHDLTLQKQRSKQYAFSYVDYINSFFQENDKLNDKDEDYLKALEFQEEELAEYFKELEDEEQANQQSKKSYNHS